MKHIFMIKIEKYLIVSLAFNAGNDWKLEKYHDSELTQYFKC